MHIPSERNYHELLSCPSLIRLEMANGDGCLEPTLLIKAKTYMLKYITAGVPMKLSFAVVESRLLYALTISDDDSQGSTIWSIAETDVELKAFEAIARGTDLTLALFNEGSVNSAFNVAKLSQWSRPTDWNPYEIKIGNIVQSDFTTLANDLMDLLDQESAEQFTWAGVCLSCEGKWKIIQNHFITEMAVPGLLDLSEAKEGEQQELLALWLTGSLKPGTCYHSPQVPKGQGTREMTDLLLTSKFGAIAVESKCLTIIGRSKLPNRDKLRRDIASHVTKATNQLKGALRAIKSGVPISSKDAHLIDVERLAIPHAIILVPDLDLINPDLYDVDYMISFMQQTEGFIHLMDLSELLRAVQAAEFISRERSLSPIEAFDYYLTQRVDAAFERNTLRVEVLLRHHNLRDVPKTIK